MPLKVAELYESKNFPRAQQARQYLASIRLRRGDCRSESGRNPAPALPASTGAIFEQHPGAGSSSDQTTSEGQAELSRVPSSRANHCGIRGYTHDPQGAGAVGQQRCCSQTESVHRSAVRSGCLSTCRQLPLGASHVTVFKVATLPNGSIHEHCNKSDDRPNTDRFFSLLWTGPRRHGPDQNSQWHFTSVDHHGLLALQFIAYCFFGVTSIKGIAPPVTLGILPFHF